MTFFTCLERGARRKVLPSVRIDLDYLSKQSTSHVFNYIINPSEVLGMTIAIEKHHLDHYLQQRGTFTTAENAF
ncbi:Semaphorin-3F [Manis pentadactyla]|nr:Semaphorin-3F [Manis pentadactyla]